MLTLTAPLSADSRRLQGLVCAGLGAIAFSGKAIVAKLMYRMGVDAFAVVGLRMTFALPMFLLMAWLAGRSFDGPQAGPRGQLALTASQGWKLAGLGFTGYYLASTLDFMGLQYISASLERAILYLNPTIVLLLSALWFRRRIRASQLAAMGLAYFGVAIVWLHDWDTGAMVSSNVRASAAAGVEPVQAIVWGSVLVLGSALSYAIYLMGSGEMVKQLGSGRLVGWASCVACGLCLAQWLVVYRVSGGAMGSVASLPWQGWALSAVNAVFCTVLPVWLVMRGVQLVGPPTAAQVGMVGPLSTIWMAAWLLQEPVTWRLIAGTAAILLGIVILTRSRPDQAAGQLDKA